MNDSQGWIELIVKLPNWVKGTIGFITLVVGFIIGIRNNFQLTIFVVAALFLLTLLALSVYVLFARTKPLLPGGRGVNKYEKYRSFGKVGIFVIPIVMAFFIMYLPSQSFIMQAIFGTPTPTPTATPQPTADVVIDRILPLLDETNEADGFEALVINGASETKWINSATIDASFVGRLDCAVPAEPDISKYLVTFSLEGQTESISPDGVTIIKQVIGGGVDAGPGTRYKVEGSITFKESCSITVKEIKFTIPLNVKVPAKGRARVQLHFQKEASSQNQHSDWEDYSSFIEHTEEHKDHDILTFGLQGHYEVSKQFGEELANYLLQIIESR